MSLDVGMSKKCIAISCLMLLFLAAFVFVGCGDDSSASVNANDEPGIESSSSVIPGNDPESSSSSAKSSSSVKSNGSSSVIPGNDPESSGSSAKSSSSSVNSISYSSLQDNKLSSSSMGKTLSSSSLNGFDWSLPKEAFLNPEIKYDSITDSRDGKVYKTVKIGDQVWMAENLNYYDATNLSVKTQSWCYGKSDNKDASTCNVAGRLYTWAAAIDSAKLYTDKSIDCGYDKTCSLPDTVYGVCPPGWHLPNRTEWDALITAAGGESIAGKVLKSQTGWYSGGDGTDAFGFSAFPVGYMSYEGLFIGNGGTGFWSVSENNSDVVYSMFLDYSYENAILGISVKNFGFSIRCVKN